MKQDVERLGTAGKEVVVKAGYARNFLYPKRLAVYATDQNRQLFKQEDDEDKEAAESIARTRKLIARKLKRTPLVFSVETSQRGLMFGSVR